MGDLVRKVIRGAAFLSVLGLGSCDYERISEFSGRDKDYFPGIEYADSREGIGSRINDSTYHCGRKIPRRMNADSVARDTVRAGVIITKKAVANDAYTGVITGPSQSLDILNTDVVIAGKFVVDSLDVNLIHSPDAWQTCLLGGVGEDTLRFDLVETDEIIAYELDVGVVW